MQEPQKRLLLIGGFILSVFAIGFAMYLVFFRAEKNTQTEQPPEQTAEQETGSLTPSKTGAPQTGGVAEGTGALPQAAEVASGGVTKTVALTTGAVTNTTISSNGKSVNFYNKDDGHFYTIDKDGNVVSLSNKSFPNVERASWNQNASKAVLTFPDQSKIVYDFQNQTQVTLPKHWESVQFSPVADNLIAKSMTLDPNNRWLVIANDHGSNVVPIQALGEHADKVEVNWSPNDQVVAFADTASIVGDNQESGFDTNVIYPIGKNQENFKGLVIQGFGFKPLWSPGGKTLLYSAYSDYSRGKPLLWAVDATASSMGEHRRSLGLNTWSDKCVWGTEITLYCAVPQNLPDNAGLQQSLYAGNPDVLHKIDLTNGKTSVVAIPDQDTTMKNLSVSKDESALYYTDASSGQLKVIKLK